MMTLSSRAATNSSLSLYNCEDSNCACVVSVQLPLNHFTKMSAPVRGKPRGVWWRPGRKQDETRNLVNLVEVEGKPRLDAGANDSGVAGGSNLILENQSRG